MESLQEFLAENKNSDIFAIAKRCCVAQIAQYIDNHIALNWQTLLQKNSDRLLDAFNRVGDMAYGAYCYKLFRPVHKQLKQAGLRPLPWFPGDFSISREWDNADESDQQRWMWSTIASIEGESLGTIVTIVFHDHNQFRLPRQPEVIALTETSKEGVVEALSERSADFKNAHEFKIEYEDKVSFTVSRQFLAGIFKRSFNGFAEYHPEKESSVIRAGTLPFFASSALQ